MSQINIYILKQISNKIRNKYFLKIFFFFLKPSSNKMGPSPGVDSQKKLMSQPPLQVPQDVEPKRFRKKIRQH